MVKVRAKAICDRFGAGHIPTGDVQRVTLAMKPFVASAAPMPLEPPMMR